VIVLVLVAVLEKARGEDEYGDEDDYEDGARS
jgi:hypothetical protein